MICKKCGKKPEIFALFLYAAAHLAMALMHEPFFDEAEAWQIARSVSLRTLFLETTHYEGHPPLWHLILMPFAKAGAPYELTLTLVSLAFMGTAGFLILWYAPFPRPVRLLLPFTYFFFYQYGVISRVYCVMTLAFVLSAITYQKRNERPGRYVAALLLLCLTTAYGLVIAGGLAFLWLWEILRGDGRRENSGSGKRRTFLEWLCALAADRRIRWLALLLAAALIVVWMILPRTDTYAIASAASETAENPFPVRLLYTFLVLPADAAFTDIYSDHVILSQAYLMPSAMASGALIGAFLWAVMLYYGKKRGTALLLVLPYSLFAVFSAVMYFSLHHIGIGLLFFCFWCWATTAEAGAEKAEEACLPEAGAEHAAKRRYGLRRTIADAETAAHILTALALGISLYWTAAACKTDIENTYAPGRKEAAFIREHHLEGRRIMTGWLTAYDEEGNLALTDINQTNLAVNLAPYFAHNLFFNFNGGQDDRNYVTHIRLSEEETQQAYESWRQGEAPEVLWMTPDLLAVYGGAVTMRDYAPVYRGEIRQVWKAGADYYGSEIHVRRDLMEETGLRPMQSMWTTEE
ncbi:MAG: hypothetical protein NC302_08210 [Bacteroidales bacterium]|nr:hypothetical protein [Bacteroidales bacterium]MCM1415110.1 hypothetical protein [bacterium]MCM1423810.1 hypothetical protein [bacterium]